MATEAKSQLRWLEMLGLSTPHHCSCLVVENIYSFTYRQNYWGAGPTTIKGHLPACSYHLGSTLYPISRGFIAHVPRHQFLQHLGTVHRILGLYKKGV